MRRNSVCSLSLLRHSVIAADLADQLLLLAVDSIGLVVDLDLMQHLLLLLLLVELLTVCLERSGLAEQFQVC